MKEIAINVENVSMEYRITGHKIDSLKEYFIEGIRGRVNYNNFSALKNVSLKIEKGERIGIIGHNGAGKSTLLKIICGVMKPTTGVITVNGEIAPLMELGAGFDLEFSGEENIFLNGAILGCSKKFLEAKYDEIVEFADLDEFLYVPIKNYSSGMRAKLGFSIATVINPDILIIDEVLGVGDERFKKKSSDKIMEMIDQGKTVLIVSHNLNRIRDLTDRVIWMEKGAIKAIGDKDNICDEYAEYMKKKKQARKRRRTL
jgi:ABC-type polysaccharide/polyol phosphate transport system ATPase subunit